ncbi:MAG: peptidoglycan-binding domain-containing protein [Candidatus Acidiferrum sp.]
MAKQLGKTTFRGVLLTAVVAGGLSLPASAAQSTTTAHKKTTGHKGTSGTTTHKSSTASTHKSSSTTAAHTTTTGKTKTTTTSGKGSHGKGSSKHAVKKVKGQAAPTPERVNEIQEALARNGAYEGTSSGKWDDSTTEAMRKFQATHGLNPTGKLDAPTLQKLGFGSETAGLGAPTPPPNAVGNRLLSPAAKRDEAKEQSDPQ